LACENRKQEAATLHDRAARVRKNISDSHAFHVFLAAALLCAGGMILLGVNIDHCATVRQARYRQATATVGGAVEPDPVTLAVMAERAGADGITVHLREDRRHIQERDVWRLRETIATRLNLEMACTPAMTEFALKLRPESVCLVPESREEVTTEGGLDVAGGRDRVAACIEAMNTAGISTSLFIDPDPAQIELAAKLRAPWIELHTGAYANAYYDARARAAEYKRLAVGATLAHDSGLVVNAGHGINYVNIAEVRALPHLHEINIGHSIISRALFAGIDEAVREMKRRMNG
jgi:pyridoxine 5-phosphate synthase